LLFVSFASYLDDANGASVASRAMMEALARRGFVTEVLCGPLREVNIEIDLPSFLTAKGLRVNLRSDRSWNELAFRTQPQTPAHLLVYVNGVPITILSGSTRPRAPGEEEQQDFLLLLEDACTRFKPEVVISYGGGSLIREVLRRAKARGAATVFSLHNLRYHDPTTFIDVDAVLVASHFAAKHYLAHLGLRCTVLPNLVDFPRALALNRLPTYVVFVNPTVEKGVGIFARIADELGRTRPDIPFLVVESKGTEADVAASGLDLLAHGNVFFHEHTSDPRRFWRVARVCLLPSVVDENQPLVAIEAMINGVPVIGSNRGGIPETLGSAGSVVPVPDRLSPLARSLPTAEEVSPWVEAILELWDSPEVYEHASGRALLEARRWAPETVEPLYEHFFKIVESGRDFSQPEDARL
jgi:glycosyltransferase involved in cell wall biosynthesis